jgi:hypothetical protein
LIALPAPCVTKEVHSVENTAANVHELNTATDRLHGDERRIYCESGHIGIEKRNDFQYPFRGRDRTAYKCGLEAFAAIVTPPNASIPWMS